MIEVEGRQGDLTGDGSAPPDAQAQTASRLGVLLARLSAAAEADVGPAEAFLHQWLVQRYGVGFEDAALDHQRMVSALDCEIAEIDAALSDQVNAILHAPAFQRLEARWRGLLYLANAALESERCKLRLLDLSWRELVRDLERASDFDQSELFNKIYTQEFGSPGGEPYGLLIGDYQVHHRPMRDHPTDDVGALKSLAMVGAASFSPIILGLSPSVLQLDSFRDLGGPVDLRTVFTQTEYDRWANARNDDDMRFIGLTLPRVLMRPPYGPDIHRNDGFQFVESTHDLSGETHLWGNAAFAFGSIVIRAFATSGWFADLRGAPRDEVRGGLVTDLPVISFATDRPGCAIKPSIEYELSEAQDHELAEMGFMSVRNVKYTDYSVFYGAPSFQRLRYFDRDAASVNFRLSSMLQYTLCISRFAHYIKVLGRDRVGSNMTAAECEDFLNRWLLQYCEGSDDSSQEVKARCPLRQARVDVHELPAKPGSYACTIFLRPHYQLDDIAAGFRLTTELAPKKAA